MLDARVKLSQEDIRKMAGQLDILRRAYPDAARAALYDVSTDIMQKAVENTPEDTGFLRRSAYVQSGKTKTKFGYGAWYAAIVNGRTNINPKRGRAEFFRKTLQEEFPTMLQRLVDATKRHILDGSGPRAAVFPETPPEGDGYRGKKKRKQGPSVLALSGREGGFARRRGRKTKAKGRKK